MAKENLTVGLNAELQKIVDILAESGYETYGIEQEGHVDLRVERPKYKVYIAKAVSKIPTA